jgi:hypothetical protein
VRLRHARLNCARSRDPRVRRRVRFCIAPRSSVEVASGVWLRHHSGDISPCSHITHQLRFRDVTGLVAVTSSAFPKSAPTARPSPICDRTAPGPALPESSCAARSLESQGGVVAPPSCTVDGWPSRHRRPSSQAITILVIPSQFARSRSVWLRLRCPPAASQHMIREALPDRAVGNNP